jgi:hypothetical protein
MGLLCKCLASFLYFCIFVAPCNVVLIGGEEAGLEPSLIINLTT